MADQVDHNKTITVDSDVDPEVMDRASRIQEELNGKENGVAINAPPVEEFEDEMTTGISLDASPVETQAPKQEPGPKDETVETLSEEKVSEEEKGPEINSEALADFLKAQNLSEEDFKKAVVGDQKITLKLKGKDRELSMHELKSLVGREESFQRRFDKLSTSDELKLGTLLKAAEGGDKGAMKKIQGMLKTATGAENEDEIVDKLEDVQDEFDETEALEKQQAEEEEAEIFADVEKDVDFSGNMDKIETSLKPRMPAKVFQAYWDEPVNRRTMYDLIASGRDEELFTAFGKELSSLSLEKQLQIEDDPDEYGRVFLAVVKRENDKQTEDQPDGSAESKAEKQDPMDSVSSGSRGRNPSNAGGDAPPDFNKMSSEEFFSWKAKNVGVF